MEEKKVKKKVKKRYIVFAIMFILAIIIVYGNKGNGSSTVTTKSTQKAGTDEVTYEDTTFKFVDYEVITNDTGKDVVVAYFDFMNNTKDTTNAALYYKTYCFQNGIELDMPTIKVVDEQGNITRNVQPGTTIRIAQSFILNDKSAVNLSVQPIVTFTDKKFIEKTLEIEK